MRFGLGQFTLQKVPWDSRSFTEMYNDFIRIAVLAEELGFDSIWMAEHHGASDGYIPSLLPMHAAIASRTSRIELGTAVILAPFHDPLRIAEDAAVVDLISGGRLRLGLGLGWVKHEYEMFGVPMKGRGKRLSEFVEILRLAWTIDRFDYQGEFYSLKDVIVAPHPAHPIPIFLGGNDGRALERAARIADGHFPPSTAGPADGVARARAIKELRDSVGASGPYRYGMFLPIGMGDDPDQAWASIRDGLLHLRGSYASWAMGERDTTNARDVAAAALEQPTRDGVLLGTPEEIVASLRPAIAEIDSLGFDDTFISSIIVTNGMSYEVAAERMTLFAERVIKPLRH